MSAFLKLLIEEHVRFNVKNNNDQNFPVPINIYNVQLRIIIRPINVMRTRNVFISDWFPGYVDVSEKWLDNRKLTEVQQAAFAVHRLKGEIRYAKDKTKKS